MSHSRIVSNPVQLQPLSLVKKNKPLGGSPKKPKSKLPPPVPPKKPSAFTSSSEQLSRSNSVTSSENCNITRKKPGLHIPIQPQSTPTKLNTETIIPDYITPITMTINEASPIKYDNFSNTPGQGPSTLNQELLYKLASKKRQIDELKLQLSQAESELKEIEKEINLQNHFNDNSKWITSAQKTLDGIKNKKSIQNFFNNISNATTNELQINQSSSRLNSNTSSNSIPYPTPRSTPAPRQNSNNEVNAPPPLPLRKNANSINTKENEQKRSSIVGGFNFRNIIHKINEYTLQDAEEEEEFDKYNKRDLNRLYDSQRLTLDSDEDEEQFINPESTPSSRHGSYILDDMNRVPKSTYRRG